MAITKAQLEGYCKKEEIYVPPRASRAYLLAAIVRHTMRGKEVNFDACFGWWERDCIICMSCDTKDDCYKTSMGMSQTEYDKIIERLENPNSNFGEG